MKVEVRRDDYLDILKGYRDTNVVKFIVGMRNSGKRALLDRFEEHLRDEGVDGSHIFRVNFGHYDVDIKDRATLERRLRELPDDECYILLSEIQNIEGWELTVAALSESGNRDVYLACSDFDISEDRATYLSGRYIVIPVYPLSFREYLELYPGDEAKIFSKYVEFGGLPSVVATKEPGIRRGQLEGAALTVMIRDVLGDTDGEGIEKAMPIALFLFSNVGVPISMASVARGAGVSSATAEKYVRAMEKAFLFHRIEKYDIAKGRLLRTNGRFYASDTGVMYECGGRDPDALIENVVCLELLRRGYLVRTGSYRGRDVDFIAIKGDEVEYYQVTQTMLSEETREREFGSLRPIRDNFPKTILTLDRLGLGTEGGIRVVNLYDWLLSRGPEYHPTDAHIRTG